MENTRELNYFFGANSAQGFITKLDNIQDSNDPWANIILKGADGTGKSKIINIIAQEVCTQSTYVEKLHSCIDISSIDGLFFQTEKISVLNGSYPNNIEAKNHGFLDNVVSLYNLSNKCFLRKHQDEIMALNLELEHSLKQNTRYLYAVGMLLSQIKAITTASVLDEKITSYAKNFVVNKLGTSSTASTTSNRFLSAVTYDGYLTYSETITKQSNTTYLFHDNYNIVSSKLLEEIYKQAVGNNHSVICCYSPLFPFTQIEHLIFPDAKVAFVTNNMLNNLELETVQNIHYTRFVDSDILSEQATKLKYLEKTALSMLNESYKLLQIAKSTKDSINKYYQSSVYTSDVKKLACQILKEYF